MCKKACSDILPHFQALPHQNLPLPVPPSPFFPCVLERCRQVSSVSVIPGQTSEQALYWATALDPIRLFQQVEQLQQAIFRYAVSGSAPEQQAPLPSLLKFDLEGHAITSCLLEGMGHDEGSVSPHNNQKPQESVHVLDWRRTSKDPFAGQWEQILFWVQTNPTRNPILSASPSQGQASSENAGMASNSAASVTRLSAAGTPSPSRQSDH